MPNSVYLGCKRGWLRESGVAMTDCAVPALAPPAPPNDKAIATLFPDDEIRNLGDKIANLTVLEAKELSEYLEWKDSQCD